MNHDQFERFVVSFESIARSLEGLNDTAERAFNKQFPEPSLPREAVITRVRSDQDKLREAQGASDQPSGEWLSGIVKGREFIGVREREFLKEQQQNARAKGRDKEKSDGIGSPKNGDQSKAVDDSTSDNAAS